jgi:DNA-binding ferritin-like protein
LAAVFADEVAERRAAIGAVPSGVVEGYVEIEQYRAVEPERELARGL